MKNFLNIAADKAAKTSADPSPADWAARAYSVVALLGNRNEIDDDLGDILAELLAKAPAETAAYGVVMVMAARAQQMGGEQPPTSGLI